MEQENIIEIAKKARAKGFENARARDVMFVANKLIFDYESVFLYKSIINSSATEDEVCKYESSDLIRFIEREVASLKLKKYSSYNNSISFDENRQGLEEELNNLLEIRKKTSDGFDAPLDIKDQLALSKGIADIRVKLNDKFGSNEKEINRVVSVHTKNNFICPINNKECYIATKEDLINKYGLIDKKDLERKYTLIPK